MNASRDRRALDLFEETLDWPETGPLFDARLEAVCEGDAQLLAAVRRLIVQDRRATRVIPTAPQPAPKVPDRPPPERIARWTLRELIGAGGMGTVYRAERADGVFEQTVAIKLLRPGLLSLAAEVRFADERRMLARLSHPNIAQIYDGGTHSETGHAWLAMEYVTGTHITAYVAQSRATLAERLRLFAATCEAVQHAHQNLIVHADIKPSNILVTRDGQVKLVDFGIAQWLSNDDDFGKAAPRTSSGTPEALTPDYAAPERFTGAMPTPVGDVYSLGVVLGEILAIRPAVTRDVDLRAILTMARAPDPAQRYGTVAALADDIRRYTGKFPLRARPRTWHYVTERFVRRHPASVTAGVLATAALIGATIVMSALYVRAERARAQADERFQEVRSLAKFMIFDLYDEFARVPGTTAGRRTLVSTAQKYLDRLGTERAPPLDLKLETLVGRARLASVAGVPGSPNLGDVVAARTALDRVIADMESLTRQTPDRTDIREELAYALAQRGAIDIWYENKPEAARPRLNEALKLLPASDGSPRALDVRQLVYLRQSDMEDWAENLPALERVIQTAFAELATWPTALRASDSYARYDGRMRVKLGDLAYYRKDAAGALVHYREADDLLRAAMTRWPDRPELMSIGQLAAWSIATTLSSLDRNVEALAKFEESVALLERMRTYEKNDVALTTRAFVARSAYAEALSLVGRYDEALDKLGTLIREREERARAAPEDAAAARGVAYDMLVRATVLNRAGRKSQACRGFADAVERFSALDREGRLPAWDRKEHLGEARTQLSKCGPQSARTPTE